MIKFTSWTLLFFLVNFSTFSQSKSSLKYPFKISETENFGILKVSQTEFDNWANNYSFQTDQHNIAPITNQLYKTFKDNFDFIFFVLDQPETKNGIYGLNESVSNAIEGIGLEIYSRAFEYGSNGRLKSFMTISGTEYIKNGPFLHELCHNWANHGLPIAENSVPCGVNKKDYCFTSTSYSHWGFAGCGGQLGGFDQSTLVANVDKKPNKYNAFIRTADCEDCTSLTGFSLNANGGNSVPFSKFEMYLMGFIPLHQVPSFDVFTNVTISGKDIAKGDNGSFYAGKKETYTNSKIEEVLGKRKPDFANSQKEFNALVVLVTTKDVNAVPKATLSSINNQIVLMGKEGDDEDWLLNFWEATNGAATLQFVLKGNTY